MFYDFSFFPIKLLHKKFYQRNYGHSLRQRYSNLCGKKKIPKYGDYENMKNKVGRLLAIEKSPEQLIHLKGATHNK